MSPTMQLDFTEVFNVQSRLNQAGFEVVKSVNLYNFNGEPGYAAVHG
jgi:isocitrate dehydrogenase